MSNTTLQSMHPNGLKIILDYILNLGNLSEIDTKHFSIFINTIKNREKLNSIIQSMVGGNLSAIDYEFLFVLTQTFIETNQIVIPQLKEYNVFSEEVVHRTYVDRYSTYVESFLPPEQLKDVLYEYNSASEVELFDSDNLTDSEYVDSDYGDYSITDVEEV